MRSAKILLATCALLIGCTGCWSDYWGKKHWWNSQTMAFHTATPVTNAFDPPMIQGTLTIRPNTVAETWDNATNGHPATQRFQAVTFIEVHRWDYVRNGLRLTDIITNTISSTVAVEHLANDPQTNAIQKAVRIVSPAPPMPPLPSATNAGPRRPLPHFPIPDPAASPAALPQPPDSVAGVPRRRT
jgi:hypothetical protein